MITKKIHTLVVMLLLGLWANALSAQEAIELKAYAQSPVVSGQQFRVTFTVNASAGNSDLRAPEFTGFSVLMGPSRSVSSSTQIINGNMLSSTSVTYTYVLLAEKEGTFNIAPATVTIKGKQYSSNAMSIKVLPQDKTGASSSSASSGAASSGGNGAAVSAENLFLRAIVSRSKLYEQESLTVTYKLYSRVDLSNVESVKLPDFEGFLVQDIEQPESTRGQLSMENYNGMNYQTLILKQSVLFPQKSGKITIPSASLDAVFRVRAQGNQRNRSIFDDFFDSYQSAKKSLKTPELTINVEPLPSQSKPTGFSGAVGNYSLKSSISTNRVKQNEAITIKLSLSGDGNIKIAKIPDLDIPSDFESYDPKVDLVTKGSTAGVSGTKSVEYLLIPRLEGEYTIPSVKFSYFDPKSKSYKSLMSDPFNITVERGEGGASASSSQANFTQRESVKRLAEDIRFIRPEFKLVKSSQYLYGSMAYLFWFIFPTLLMAIIFIVYRKRMVENANIALSKGKKAGRVAAKRLKQAAIHLQKQQKKEYYDELLKALWGYVSDKLNMPLSTLNKENIDSVLESRGVDSSTRESLKEILNSCEFARYAPDQGGEAMDRLYSEATELINKIESIIKK
ncbi:MAG: BatD family protein [Bacteroidales bacterium]